MVAEGTEEGAMEDSRVVTDSLVAMEEIAMDNNLTTVSFIIYLGKKIEKERSFRVS
jgi:hypothetical protein